MKLVASVIIDEQVERARYLDVFLTHLHDFCDDICIVRDGEDGVDFFAHEGRARQRLLEKTLAAEPTHVIAIDADEFVADGAALRALIEARPDLAAFPLTMEEVWEAHPDGLCIREDGGWASHPIPNVWRVPATLDPDWRIADRALACGRVPVPIDRATAYLGIAGAQVATEILHFGWTNEASRQARYDRYVVADGGRFHASRHLESILWPCDQIRLRPREWPAALAAHQDAISACAGIVAG